jgi:hypothetical protein
MFDVKQESVWHLDFNYYVGESLFPGSIAFDGLVPARFTFRGSVTNEGVALVLESQKAFYPFAMYQLKQMAKFFRRMDREHDVGWALRDSEQGFMFVGFGAWNSDTFGVVKATISIKMGSSGESVDIPITFTREKAYNITGGYDAAGKLPLTVRGV